MRVPIRLKKLRIAEEAPAGVASGCGCDALGSKSGMPHAYSPGLPLQRIPARRTISRTMAAACACRPVTPWRVCNFCLSKRHVQLLRKTRENADTTNADTKNTEATHLKIAAAIGYEVVFFYSLVNHLDNLPMQMRHLTQVRKKGMKTRDHWWPSAMKCSETRMNAGG